MSCLQTLRVMYPYLPQNDDELELVPGDFVFMSPVDQSGISEGWVYGTSLATGLSGLLPENYVSLADESDTWVFHGWAPSLTLAQEVAFTNEIDKNALTIGIFSDSMDWLIDGLCDWSMAGCDLINNTEIYKKEIK